MAGGESKKGIGISLGILALQILILGILVFEPTQGLDPSYVQLFMGLFIFGIFGNLIFLFWGVIKSDDEETYTPRVFDDNPDRPLSQWNWIKIASVIILIIFFAGFEIASQRSVIPIINPYNTHELVTSKAQFSTVGGTVMTAIRSGVYAGVGEDIAGWVITTVIIIIILLILKRVDEESFSNKGLIALAIFIAAIIWGLFFATSHKAAYGTNLEAYIGAFTYGFTSQFINQLVGAPISIFAHFAHNFSILFVAGVGLSIGAAQLATTIIVPKLFSKRQKINRFPEVKFMKKISKICVPITLVVILLIMTGCQNGKLLDIGSNNCDNNYKAIPESPSCNTDSECLTALVPQGQTLDTGTIIRCNNQVCEVKISTCEADTR